MRAEFLSWFCRPFNEVRVFRMFDRIEAAGGPVLPSTQLSMVPASLLASYATGPVALREEGDDSPLPEFQVDCGRMMQELALEMAILKPRVLEDEAPDNRFASTGELTQAIRSATVWASHLLSVSPRYESYDELHHLPDTLLHSWELRDVYASEGECYVGLVHAGLVCTQCGARHNLCIGAEAACVVYVVQCGNEDCDGCGAGNGCGIGDEQECQSDEWALPAPEDFTGESEFGT